MKRLIFFVPLAAIAILLGLFLWGLNPNRDPNAIPSQLINKPAPQFDLPALEGAGVPGLKTADLADGQVKLVNFFASWCLPCRAEHPHLLDLASSGKLAIYGIAWKDKPADSWRWLQGLGNPYSRIGVDQNNTAGLDFGITGVPETYVIDGAGQVRFHHAGPLSAEDINTKLIPLLNHLREGGA